jgi:hypothetical protein
MPSINLLTIEDIDEIKRNAKDSCLFKVIARKFRDLVLIHNRLIGIGKLAFHLSSHKIQVAFYHLYALGNYLTVNI